MNVIDHDPALGGARQGDVYLWPLPSKYKLDRSDEIAVRDDGRIVVAAGEATGHHHSILAHMFDPLRFRHDAAGAAAEAAFEPRAKQGVARLYRDDQLVSALVRDGILTTASLCAGFLEVSGAPVVLEHQEHDFIRLRPGLYYAGRQQEFNAGEMRRVQD
jgi:hypothetical protein